MSCIDVSYLHCGFRRLLISVQQACTILALLWIQTQPSFVRKRADCLGASTTLTHFDLIPVCCLKTIRNWFTHATLPPQSHLFNTSIASHPICQGTPPQGVFGRASPSKSSRWTCIPSEQKLSTMLVIAVMAHIARDWSCYPSWASK